MACVIVPAAEAIATAVVGKIVKKKEEKIEEASLDGITVEEVSRIPFSRKLKWLTYMLLGGVVLLAFEHVWHGEIVPFFPFLTAASSAEATNEMLHEMATTGVLMTVIVTAVWILMVVVSTMIENNAIKAAKELKK